MSDCHCNYCHKKNKYKHCKSKNYDHECYYEKQSRNSKECDCNKCSKKNKYNECDCSKCKKERNIYICSCEKLMDCDREHDPCTQLMIDTISEKYATNENIIIINITPQKKDAP